MPTLALFYGILIKMNWRDTGQHNMPHFHAIYGESKASFTLNGEVIVGKFPNKQSALVKAWALVHEEDLLANWNLAMAGEETFRIDPLR
jgi:hypothetical protein